MYQTPSVNFSKCIENVVKHRASEITTSINVEAISEYSLLPIYLAIDTIKSGLLDKLG
jgi:hypothetical protein